VSCDDLEELYRFGDYMNRLGNLKRNAGEASVLAWAEVHSAAAYIDDQVACNVGRGRGVRVHRTLQLVISAFRASILTEARARELIRSLADADARFPRAARDDLFGWARSRVPPLL
jgi:predicted nucleic acid-binding protein